MRRGANRLPVIDTSFLIDLQQGLDSAKRALRTLETAECILPLQAAAEYLAGLEDPVAGLSLLSASYTVQTPTEAHLLEMARLANRVRRPQWGDIQIAASAALDSTYVITANPKDFEALGCRVWDYRHNSKPPG